MRKVLIFCLLLSIISCGKEDEVRGCYILTVTVTFTASYSSTPSVQKLSTTVCDATESDMKGYVKSSTYVKTESSSLGWETTSSVATYKKQ